MALGWQKSGGGAGKKASGWIAFVLTCMGATGGPAHAHTQSAEPRTIAAPAFVPPAPGSYRLEKIMPAPEGIVLDVEGRPRKLSRYLDGKVTLFAFMYTRCKDPDGCPLAYQVMVELKQRIEATPRLHDKVRFLSLSFDPKHDTAHVMQLYASHLRRSRGLDWFFLTTRSPRELTPLLEGFGQDVALLEGDTTSSLSHVLKVFLIDARRTVREIYSTSYLIAQMVLNDIETLILEDRVGAN
jgi:protein SCO1/2